MVKRFQSQICKHEVMFTAGIEYDSRGWFRVIQYCLVTSSSWLVASLLRSARESNDFIEGQRHGIERCQWHHDPACPRLFFFPLIGPSGKPLTRMGHPGAENHGSVWFAFNDVAGRSALSFKCLIFSVRLAAGLMG